MIDHFLFVVIIIVASFFIGGLAYLGNKNDHAFEARLAQEETECRSRGESEYTCKTYIVSLRTKRSAEAAQEAGTAETFSAIAIGLTIGGFR